MQNPKATTPTTDLIEALVRYYEYQARQQQKFWISLLSLSVNLWFPSSTKGHRAIRSVEQSVFGDHRVIRARFGS